LAAATAPLRPARLRPAPLRPELRFASMLGALGVLLLPPLLAPL